MYTKLKRIILDRLPSNYREKLRELKIKFLKLTRKDLEYFYDERFATNERRRNKKWNSYLCELVMNKYSPKSIVDFGCGTGDILEPFEKIGIEVLGIDGSKANQRHTRIKSESFLLFDLRNRCKLEKRYDLCFCIEVAEHLEEKYSDILLENLVSSSSVILFTAAVPGQEGVDHCNLKPHKWWIEKFQKIGFELDNGDTSWLRSELTKNPEIPKWFIKNWHIFKGKN